MKEKLISIFQKTKQSLADSLLSLDSKISTLIPNQKVKKIAYIGIGSLFGFMGLIIILGLLLSPLRKTDNTEETVLNKANIIVDSPEPQIELSENQKQILLLKNEINNLKFPESILSIPTLEKDLTI